MKWCMVSKIQFERGTISEDNETISSYFRSKCYYNLREGSILYHIDEEYLDISQLFEDFIL